MHFIGQNQKKWRKRTPIIFQFYVKKCPPTFSGDPLSWENDIFSKNRTCLIWWHISPEPLTCPEWKNIGLTLWPIRKTSFRFGGHVRCHQSPGGWWVMMVTMTRPRVQMSVTSLSRQQSHWLGNCGRGVEDGGLLLVNTSHVTWILASDWLLVFWMDGLDWQPITLPPTLLRLGLETARQILWLLVSSYSASVSWQQAELTCSNISGICPSSPNGHPPFSTHTLVLFNPFYFSVSIDFLLVAALAINPGVKIELQGSGMLAMFIVNLHKT